MQVYEYREPFVQRNMDLTRELLLKIESDPRLDGMRWIRYHTAEEMGITGHSDVEVGYHLSMLIEEGFLVGRDRMETMPVLHKLTWRGHELLDDIRDETIWGKTKERAKESR
jgi:Hypothetical protein (DUF2513)